MKKLGALLAAAALLITGCGSSSGGSESRTLTVFAAASLTESFTALKTAFESAHAGTEVKFNFAGSSSLVQQLSNGASADVFASADQPNMDKAVQAGVVDGAPSVFATNKLAIAVAPGNPKGIRSFADLARDGLTVVVCAPQVPCGSATEKVEKSTGVTLKPASEEQDVKQALNKVRTGDADAGLVYVTDATSAAGAVDRVDFPEATSAVNSYPIAVVKNAPRAELARQWVEFVLGEQGRAELRKAGFGAP
ncbi:molybdate-binding protein [Amycolatopsis deserti]|uniref:Molybdate-binding protein n=1 Tax=Amycolatopsis deserti TaxID=185696 RepID=A0ABQ3J8I3_9PSEU|nr:molybdate ABC transporter substrate-binding protein [Amycolatopsis deserti]GHF02137.1 molybdate-binding protein [Amycolatopsis deserti]